MGACGDTEANKAIEKTLTQSESQDKMFIPKNTLTITDNSTGKLLLMPHSFYLLGKQYELEIKDGAIIATDLAKIKDP